MATEAIFRPHVDQENPNPLNFKGGNASGRKFGATKSFKSSNVPITTPRRALGDVGNTLRPAATNSRKGLALKPNKLLGKTPTTKIFQDHTRTPSAKGKLLLKQISSAEIKQSRKQKKASQTKTAVKPKAKEEQDLSEREVMYPFTDTDDVLPRSNHISTILKNVGALYYGCQLHPTYSTDSDAEDNAADLFHFDDYKRPATDNSLDSLPFERELDSLTPQFDCFSLSDIELPPVDIDSLGLGLL
ncbi:uncharacterized protein LOC111344164 [Stylophora pistillata]|uniref:Securin n=1 Tax=Stylophora pistillata TaxID=50429 RepID=A0A2B4RFA1_STYPI|nr:uncharacterized protein LOC111344164 [Stylophora pistillata]PFX14955.1 hypothetical protein AWC38_SpisGene20854 [Stylophora pistillata]